MVHQNSSAVIEFCGDAISNNSDSPSRSLLSSFSDVRKAITSSAVKTFFETVKLFSQRRHFSLCNRDVYNYFTEINGLFR